MREERKGVCAAAMIELWPSLTRYSALMTTLNT